MILSEHTVHRIIHKDKQSYIKCMYVDMDIHV